MLSSHSGERNVAYSNGFFKSDRPWSAAANALSLAPCRLAVAVGNSARNEEQPVLLLVLALAPTLSHVPPTHANGFSM